MYPFHNINKEKIMNRKNILIVIFMVIGALVVSAFSLVTITNENNRASLQRGREADAARYTAMAKYYTAKDGADLQRGRDADAARYTAMAEYYAASQTSTAVQYGPPGR
jgi:hypothetical protein